MSRRTELDLWQHAHDLALDVYRATAAHSRIDPWLVRIVRNTAVAIPSRIARSSSAAFRITPEGADATRCLLEELKSQLLLLRDLGCLSSYATDILWDRAEHFTRALHAHWSRVLTEAADAPALRT